MTPDELARQVGHEAGLELSEAMVKIRHCVDQLDDAQLWWRPQPALNSIGNLLLHVAGNLTQWITSHVGGAPDTRNRPAEFAERGPIPKRELMARLEAAVADATAALEKLDAENAVRPRRIQSFSTNGIGAIFHSVAHFRGHTQEIIHMTRTLLADAYRFQWQPSTPEQGAAKPTT